MASSSLGRALRSGLRLSNQRLASAVQRRTYYDERYPWTHPVAPKSASQVAYTIDFPERSAVAILDVNWEKLPQSEKDKVDPLIRAGKLYITRDDLYFFELPLRYPAPFEDAIWFGLVFFCMLSYPLWVLWQQDKMKRAELAAKAEE